MTSCSDNYYLYNLKKGFAFHLRAVETNTFMIQVMVLKFQISHEGLYCTSVPLEVRNYSFRYQPL